MSKVPSVNVQQLLDILSDMPGTTVFTYIGHKLLEHVMVYLET